MRRLRTDYIDLYQVHWPDDATPYEETARALADLQAAGKIRAIGVSNYSIEAMERIRRAASLASAQPPLNLFEQQALTDIIPWCRTNHVATLTYGALCRGLLTGSIDEISRFEGDDLRNMDPKFLPPRFAQYIEAVRRLAAFARERYDKSILALSVRWVLDQPGVSVALWGARRPRHLDALTDVMGWRLDPNALVEIDALSARRCVIRSARSSWRRQSSRRRSAAVLDQDPSFRPLEYRAGYLPIEDFSLIGDGATCALVGRDGSVAWMCVPRFDSEPLFCSLLDRARGGHFTIAPEDVLETRQLYEPDTAVLKTELRCRTGVVQVTDALAFRAGAEIGDNVASDRAELVRSAIVLEGDIRLRVEVEPRGGAETRAALSALDVRPVRRPDLRLHLRSNRPLGGLRTVHEVRQGERIDVVLSWGRSHRHHGLDAEAMLRGTADSWRRWMRGFQYAGPQEPLVRRAAITLKLLDSFVEGSAIAAATSSLPAPIGGVRNWDYRYTWIRDAAFTVFAMRRIGFTQEADAFLGWVLDAIERVASSRVRIMYTLQGDPVPEEVEDAELEGYQRSAPVRWGNGAADQLQHDLYGEILDCADQWCRSGGRIEPYLWEGLVGLVNTAQWAWKQPDQGLWEVRSEGRVFTYSAAMCQVALSRAVAIAERMGLPGPIEQWRAEANKLQSLILDQSWDENSQTLSEHLSGGGSLDASLLALPIRRVVAFDHPRMLATTRAVAERLSAGGGLLYRYLHTDSPDGIAGDEGAFLLCSFWLVDNLARQGRLEEAMELYSSLCARASPTGLLPEQINPSTGEFMGNFPQAFSHIGVIFSGVTLAATQGKS